MQTTVPTLIVLAQLYLRLCLYIMETEKLMKTIKNWAITTFERSLPAAVIQELPSRQMYFIGFTIHFLTLCGFIAFFFSTYLADRRNTYLSPSSTSGDCWNVSKPLSGTFLADDHGRWEGASTFSYSIASYSLNFNNLGVDADVYYDLMQSLYDQLTFLGEIAKTQNLAGNLLLWMTFTSYYRDDVNVQSAAMTGDPLTVFNRMYQHGSIGNKHADCNANSLIQFDSANGYFYLSYLYSEFVSNPNCSTTLDPYAIGYNPEFDNHAFTISFDIHSVNMALAINTRVQQNGDIVMEDDSSVVYNGTEYKFVKVYDARYPGMQPIMCAVRHDFGERMLLCAIVLAKDLFAFPLLNHFGTSASAPDYCTCENSTDEDGTSIPANGFSYECNVFNLLSGFLFFNGNDTITPLFELFYKYDERNELNRLAYAAMYAGANIANTNKYQNSTFRGKAYQFCETSYGGCSVVTVNSYDTLSKSVSAYYYQLRNGSCRDTFSGTATAWNRLSTTTPIPMTESYFECSATRLTSFISAAGIATGFTATLLPFLVAFCFLCAIGYRLSKGIYQLQFDNEYKNTNDKMDATASNTTANPMVPGMNGSNTSQVVKSSDDRLSTDASAALTSTNSYNKTMIYSRFSRDNFLESLSFQLLLMRDQRLSSISPVNPQTESVLYLLMEELRSNASNDLNNINITAEYSGVHHFSTVLHANPDSATSIFRPAKPSADTHFKDESVPRAISPSFGGSTRTVKALSVSNTLDGDVELLPVKASSMASEASSVGGGGSSIMSNSSISIVVLNCERCLKTMLTGKLHQTVVCNHKMSDNTSNTPNTYCRPKVSAKRLAVMYHWMIDVMHKLKAVQQSVGTMHMEDRHPLSDDEDDNAGINWRVLTIWELSISLIRLGQLSGLELLLTDSDSGTTNSTTNSPANDTYKIAQSTKLRRILKELLVAHCRVLYGIPSKIEDEELCVTFGDKVGYMVGSIVCPLSSLEAH